MPDESKIYKDTVDLIRNRFQKLGQSDSEKIFDAILKFIADSEEQKNLNVILQDAARMIHRIFSFNEVTIGLRSPKDGLYRYEAIVGHTREAEQMMRDFAFTRAEMCDCKDYPGISVNKYTEFSLAETKPYKEGAEEKMFNRPLMLGKGRTSPTKMIEGDYVDVYIFGEKDDMIGWIEFSGPRDGNIPSRETVKWIELTSVILGVIMRRGDFAAV